LGFCVYHSDGKRKFSLINMPIALAPIHEEMQIARVACDRKESTRLAALGVIEGAPVTVLSSLHGAVIVLIKGARLALDHKTASHIFVA